VADLNFYNLEGFLQTVIKQFYREVIFRRYSKCRPAKIMICGHSLGGGLAKICALDLTINKIEGTEKASLKVITLGSPRVGNDQFRQYFQGSVYLYKKTFFLFLSHYF
jgi:predicted lipase